MKPQPFRLDARAPKRRAQDAKYPEWNYRLGPPQYLSVPRAPKGKPAMAVIKARRSSLPISSLSQKDLAAILWWTCKTMLQARVGRWEHRPTPSAGGRHPIDVVVQDLASPAALFFYDTRSHALRPLARSSAVASKRLSEAVKAVTGAEVGTVLWHAAQPARTMSRYSNGSSLVWRDAGALVAMTAIVAEALGLACCPIGITGEPWLSRALNSSSAVLGVGGCVVGDRSDKANQLQSRSQ
jgi:SagB-type dehydrogenase family enzyme